MHSWQVIAQPQINSITKYIQEPVTEQPAAGQKHAGRAVKHQAARTIEYLTENAPPH